MTGRRPQDPRTRKIRDDEADIPTVSPGGATMDAGDAGEARGAGATEAPRTEDLQRGIETIGPGETIAPGGLEPPRPRAVRGGAAATWAPDPATPFAGRAPGATMAPSTAQRTMTADGMEAMRKEVRDKAAQEEQASAKRKKRGGASWVVWVLAFLMLGGIGFGVAWLVMNPPGGGDEPEQVASAPGEGGSEAAAADAAVAEEEAEEDAAAAAGEGEVSAAGAGGDTGGEGAGGEAAVAAADGGPGEDAAAALADVGEAPGDAAVAAAADGGPGEDAAVGEVVAAAGADAGGEATVAVADTAGEVAGPSDVAAGAEVGADTQVAAAPVKLVRNPIEAARLNEDGFAARKKGDHALALKLYEQAVAADPEHVWARYNHACELALAGRPKEALAELTTLYKLGTAEAKKALAAARKDSDFASIKDSGQFFRLTNF